MLTRLACCLLVWSMFTPARAADSFDGCTAFITALPISIDAPGVYCLKGNLAVPVAPATGDQTQVAINVGTNRVTIDCKHFGIDGRPGGGAVDNWGIAMGGHRDVNVRNCSLTGFTSGVLLTDSYGNNAVEDNRFMGVRNVAITVHGDGSVVRRNIILGTDDPRPAGSGTSATAISSLGSVEITDNLIAGVSANGPVTGIIANGSAATIARNRIRGLDNRHAIGFAVGIFIGPYRPNDSGPVGPLVTIRDNDLGINLYNYGSKGIYCQGDVASINSNVLKGFQLPLDGCPRATDNDISAPVPY